LKKGETMSSVETVLAPTRREKALAAAYLGSTRDELIDTVKDLSPAQWAFQRAPGEWSAAEVVEHLAILEGRIQMLIATLPKAAPAEPGRNDADIDEFIIEAVPRRTSRFQAPEAAQPKRQCTPSEALQLFTENRLRTGLLLETATCLRGRVIPHPVLGSWDGYQWILAAAAHTARHTDQIREIKSAQGFPKSSADLKT